jgi:hypothetical protein
VILLLALAGGLPVGMAWSHWRGRAYQAPELRVIWLALLAFLPQFLLLYVPYFRSSASDRLFAFCLQASMLALLGFAWLNRRVPGMKVLLLGLALNLMVIALNGGFMPISPHTAAGLVSTQAAADLEAGQRFGAKDMLLHPGQTRFEWLADRFLTPAGFPYRAAFSLGDVFIAIGAFLLLAHPGLSISPTNRGVNK